MSINAKDLTKQAPTSPRHRTGGYAILSRLRIIERIKSAESAGISPGPTNSI
jgi:hypothetical protein